MDAKTTETEQVQERSGEIELHSNRGFFGTDLALGLSLGQRISVGLKLSSGATVSFVARVASLNTGSNTATVEVEFTELSMPERLEFCRWQQLLARRNGHTRVTATVTSAPPIERELDGRPRWTRRSPLA